MLDFLRIEEEEVERRGRESVIKIRPSFIAVRSKDLMIRGQSLYAVWDETRGLWVKSIYDLISLVDGEIRAHIEAMPEERRALAKPAFMRYENTMMLSAFLRFCRSSDDNFVPLDQKIFFAEERPKREDYASMRLSYSPVEGDISNYQEMFGLLYSPEELRKLEWSVGAILTGEAKKLHKFITIYGRGGTGKSTFLNLLEMLFEGYSASFSAKSLSSASDQFAISAFRDSPLVGFDQDGTLAKIEEDSVIDKIVSHDTILINEKGKPRYPLKLNTFLYIGSNKLVRINDMHSGLIRRLIDVSPTGKLHTPENYYRLADALRFELGAIARHCIAVFQEAGSNHYAKYVAKRHLVGTNPLHGFVDHHRFDFEEAEYVTLKQAYDWYKEYMEDAGERYRLTRKDFGEELKTYFEVFKERDQSLEGRPTKLYEGFKSDLFEAEKPQTVELALPELVLDQEVSLLDELLKDCPAQLASDKGTPTRKWAEVETNLSEIATGSLHYVKPPLNHIVIDFDLTDEEGNKSRERNLEAARKWPITYAEWSKSGNGIHLHYRYAGDPEKLSRIFAPGIEIKVFSGNSSLRRMLSTCNAVPVATLTSGLPLKEEKVIDSREVKSEQGLRRLVEKNLRKLVHPGTKPSVDFIHKILHDAYKSDLVYDLSDMRSTLIAFAMNSTNQSDYCLRLVKDLPLKSKEAPADVKADDDRLVFFDCEVYKNLFVICWKFEGDSNVVAMINPSPQEVESLFKFNLVGFNNRKYDNHILYARHMGYSLMRLYELSQALINKGRSPFGMAYNLSYTDVHDYASKKQSLKKWQIEMGIRHMEMHHPWDEEVPEELIPEIVEYCSNDVISLEELHKYRHGDFVARQILSDLSGLSVNQTTNSHSAKIIFGDVKNPQVEFQYKHLEEDFPGYIFKDGKSEYRGYDPSEGGFVASKPGMYSNVRCYDVASLHPSSLIAMNHFGDRFTKRFKEMMDARIAIKRRDYTKAKSYFQGKLDKHLQDEKDANALGYALKIVINSVYGLTSAKFDNPFRDPRNKDNIVAKRGALFMIDLMLACEEKGYEVVHIKTDSIKIANPTPETDEFILEFGRKYGYEFEIETDYKRFCLVNDAVYIALKENGKWEAVGAQFQHPYVFKTLFSGDPVEFDDHIEVKSVTTSLWLDYGRGDKAFIGRVGAFVPVMSGGGELLRKSGEDNFSYASGSKGHRWQEAEIERQQSNGRYDNLDMSYFQRLVNNALAKINQFGDAEWLRKGDQ